MEKPKPKPLETKKSDVEPVELPDRDKLYGMKEDLEEDEKSAEEPAEEEEPKSRPERRRTERERKKQESLMRSQMRKYNQEIQKPLRVKDLQLIVGHCMAQVQPQLEKINDRLDQLEYLPDYIADVLDPEEKWEMSISDFEEWFKEVKAQLEAEEAEQAEDATPEDDECSCENGCEKCTLDASPPETEATQ